MPASAQELDNERARQVALEAREVREHLGQLFAWSEWQKAQIDSLSSFRAEIYDRWLAGTVPNQTPLKMLAELEPITPTALIGDLVMKVGNFLQGLTYQAVLANIQAHFESGVVTAGHARHLASLKSYGRDLHTRLALKDLQIKRVAEAVWATGVRPIPPPAPPPPPPPPLSIDSLLAGRCIATDAPPGHSGFRGHPAVVLSITKHERGDNTFEGKLAYTDEQRTTKISGRRTGDRILFREVRVLSGDMATLGTVWRLRETGEERIGGNRLGGPVDLSDPAEATLPQLEQEPMDHRDPSYLGATRGTAGTAYLFLARGRPLEHVACDERFVEKLGEESATFVGTINGPFLDREVDLANAWKDNEPVRVTFQKGARGPVAVIECLGDDLAGSTASFDVEARGGKLGGKLVSRFLNPFHRDITWMVFTCADGGRKLVGTWRIAGDINQGPWDVELEREQ